ncbi:MAG: transposase, partial [Armatimonadota bacterium]
MDFDWRDRIVRRKRYEETSESRFITFSCDGRRELLASDWARDIVAEQLSISREQFGFALYAWVVMPNHVHPLLTPDLQIASMPRILNSIKSRSSAKILARYRQDAPEAAPVRLWLAGGGYDRNIRSDEEFSEKLEYIELNPVRAGLAKTREEYRWCSVG